MSRTRIARNVASRMVLAITRKQLLRKVNPKVQERSKGLSIRYLGFVNDRHEFEVGQREVSMTLNDGHVALKCSCPAWVYHGAEYHARQEDYLLGKPRGTAKKPSMRDSEGDTYLCKHTFAVLNNLDQYLDI